MAKQAVDTERIANTVSRLRTSNDNINREFGALRGKMKQLEENWKGSAGTIAQTMMCQMLQNSEERSKVIQNYINMLQQQVNPGYLSDEITNKKLADNFK